MPFEVLGFLGQACFFSRFLVQWLASERARRSILPPVFWWISLAGAVGLGSYQAWLGETVLLLGQFVGGSIALRNLLLARSSTRTLPLPWALGLGILGWGLAFWLGIGHLHFDEGALWLAVAVVGQTLWTSRFVVQWIASERSGTSHFPIAFWWISLAGNALLLAYTVHLWNPILIAGFVPGPIVQIRNLMLLSHRSDRRIA